MAYGHVPRPATANAALRPRVYALPERAASADRAAIICVPFRADGAATQSQYQQEGGNNGLNAPDKLVALLGEIFNAELDRGVTYPQRGPMDGTEFRGYFLGYDLIVGLFLNAEQAASVGSIPLNGVEVPLAILTSDVFQLDFSPLLAGYYYIKPNYPGRSSHLCNAGFVVPPTNRGLGLGAVLGRSFLHFGPAAGYRGSVFNLVYANNVASIRIWERLGFTKIGLLPAAGLLRTADGAGEEYVDAWIIHRDFAQDVQATAATQDKVADGSKAAA